MAIGPLSTSLLKVLLIGSSGTGIVAAVSGVWAGSGVKIDPNAGFLQLKRDSGVLIGRAKTGTGDLKVPQGATAYLLAYGDHCKWDNTTSKKRILGPVGEYEVTTMEQSTTNGKIICFKL
ncbi:hypothetical protein [Candidatus Mycoplasma haematominutum]|uniref:Uncharacterized protein n=1 Tax=Candidatus Mycoplasma haematominutum 'Birmingham 1' TaxID=1116213 RepID=G8C3K9_9MOLU|nr:hypothetical protein [Candidatus Mycoplasma haematominutum]CCE66907.1 hypothetical protein MHM_03890 [Candidatus Mycoplasma haematominutum 'Birmingham 1']